MKNLYFLNAFLTGLCAAMTLVGLGMFSIVHTYSPLIEKINNLEHKKTLIKDLSPLELSELNKLLKESSNEVIQIKYNQQFLLNKKGGSILLYEDDLGLTNYTAKKLGYSINKQIKRNVTSVGSVRKNTYEKKMTPSPRLISDFKRDQYQIDFPKMENILYIRKNLLDKNLIDFIFLNIDTYTFTCSIGDDATLMDVNFFRNYSSFHEKASDLNKKHNSKGITFIFNQGNNQFNQGSNQDYLYINKEKYNVHNLGNQYFLKYPL